MCLLRRCRRRRRSLFNDIKFIFNITGHSSGVYGYLAETRNTFFLAFFFLLAFIAMPERVRPRDAMTKSRNIPVATVINLISSLTLVAQLSSLIVVTSIPSQHHSTLSLRSLVAPLLVDMKRKMPKNLEFLIWIKYMFVCCIFRRTLSLLSSFGQCWKLNNNLRESTFDVP